MSNILQAIKDRELLKRSYFSASRDEIANSNLRFLRFASLATFFFLILFIVITPYFIKGWVPSLYHYALAVVSGVFLLVFFELSQFLRSLSPKLINVLCICYEVILYGGIMLIDVFSEPTAPSSFMQLICIALPALFVLPSLVNYSLLSLVELVYLILVLNFKDPYIAQYDIFQLCAGFSFALCLAHVVTNYRLDTYKHRAKYERLSQRDTLSNLYNKRAFYQKVTTYFEEKGSSACCSLAILDLDNFRDINTKKGHAEGDHILQKVSNTLLELFRPNDIIGRFGGDEFVILLDGLVNVDVIKLRFDKVQQHLAEISDDPDFSISCSAGIICIENMKAEFSSLFAQADETLYEAKAQGKSRFLIKPYQQDLSSKSTQAEKGITISLAPKPDISDKAKKASPPPSIPIGNYSHKEEIH